MYVYLYERRYEKGSIPFSEETEQIQASTANIKVTNTFSSINLFISPSHLQIFPVTPAQAWFQPTNIRERLDLPLSEYRSLQERLAGANRTDAESTLAAADRTAGPE
jgi:hypothetical protein